MKMKKSPPIDIISINTWCMEGLVAESFVQKSAKWGRKEAEVPRIFLVGDAAHACPPSGGFGLNTGVGDANNLAHKLALALHHNDESKLKEYDQERRPIGILARNFSIENYKKQIRLSEMMNLSKSNLDYFSSGLSSLLPSYLQKPALESGISVGLKVFLGFADVPKIAKFINADNENTIRLMFPNLDFNSAYSSMGANRAKKPFETFLS